MVYGLTSLFHLSTPPNNRGSPPRCSRHFRDGGFGGRHPLSVLPLLLDLHVQSIPFQTFLPIVAFDPDSGLPLPHRHFSLGSPRSHCRSKGPQHDPSRSTRQRGTAQFCVIGRRYPVLYVRWGLLRYCPDLSGKCSSPLFWIDKHSIHFHNIIVHRTV